MQRRHQRIDRRHPAGKCMARCTALQSRQGHLESVARRVSGPRIVISLVGADAGQLKRGRKVDGDIDGAGEGVRMLPRVHGESGIFVIRHGLRLAACSCLLAYRGAPGRRPASRFPAASLFSNPASNPTKSVRWIPRGLSARGGNQWLVSGNAQTQPAIAFQRERKNTAAPTVKESAIAPRSSAPATTMAA